MAYLFRLNNVEWRKTAWTIKCKNGKVNKKKNHWWYSRHFWIHLRSSAVTSRLQPIDFLLKQMSRLGVEKILCQFVFFSASLTTVPGSKQMWMSFLFLLKIWPCLQTSSLSQSPGAGSSLWEKNSLALHAAAHPAATNGSPEPSQTRRPGKCYSGDLSFFILS